VWGAKLNRYGSYRTRDHPAWANPAQKETWNKKGLILWDQEAQQITRLWAGIALQVLDYLRTNEEWEQRSIDVGEPATQISLDEPEKEPTQVLMDKMTLTPARLRELHPLLETAEQELQQMHQEDEKERRRRIHQVYSILIEAGRQRKNDVDC
jgi:hypothetical protein